MVILAGCLLKCCVIRAANEILNSTDSLLRKSGAQLVQKKKSFSIHCFSFFLI